MIRNSLRKTGQALTKLINGHQPAATDVRGRIRVDRRTKNMVRRLKPGEIAVIDHADLDGPAAEALVAAQAGAVINASPSITGKYPNRGPEVLFEAGIPLVDGFGPDLLDTLREGEFVHLREGELFRNGELIGTGRVMTEQRLQQELAAAREHLDAELFAFVSNTLSYLEREKGLLFEAVSLPDFAVELRDQHVLVVVRGEGARQDLATVRSYVRDRRPILIGVDGGADLLREQGFTPHIIFGDMDSVSDESLHCGAQLIVHAYPNGKCPGKARLDALGLEYEVLPGRGTSEDVIMLAAYEKGAELLIAVGTHFNLIDFLDKARGGMSSTFLVRLRVGSRLVDAKGVSRLYRVPYPLVHFSLMTLIALAVVATIVMLSNEVRSFLQFLVIQIQRMLGL